ncbi:hypothetical protein G6F57_002685 [Rhizopus arrhizus]|uniref:Acid phosphatase n=1 Tax=Rhizopus oryzae TaxID=64495 RepID=A0A9P6XGX9_RHIOR|nr:hypothetical protein G6F23_008650 [Rhizopus arrhizus]KAG1428395.1 hypothetical protein G6F58_000595 [Rhizopus delemar]KAG0763405.1 hypothetical protein G6F24_006048 [Rhizopus arrhizus]KAG0788094.1 hypothetical protein G6F22_007108 [Rhizopus arrhizus]KAG0794327.1 hypothetical protein G6F21_002952 [Rhizopus arrhizus]
MKIAALFPIAALVGIVSAAINPPQGKAFNHVLQIWFENQDFKTISNIPGFTNLQKHGILLDNYNAITHPSQPNYVASTGGSNFGIITDDYYNISANTLSIFDLLEDKGLTWRLYQEDIPSIGYTGYEAGNYVRKHNPAVSYDSIGLNATRLQNIVSANQLLKDINTKSLPNWMFYTPNLQNDGHDTNAAYAGNWLAKFYENTLNNLYLLENTLILITFDETASFLSRNRVWSLLFGAIPENLKGTTDSTFYSHYSILSTVEKNWDLPNLNRGDTDKKMSNIFDFVASKVGYQNINVPRNKAPWNNLPILGPLTGKSHNTT